MGTLADDEAELARLVEVVVLGAEDHGALERTHGRYFQQRGDVDLSRMPASARWRYTRLERTRHLIGAQVR